MHRKELLLAKKHIWALDWVGYQVIACLHDQKRDFSVVAIGLGGPVQNIKKGPFPMGSTQKSSGPLPCEML